MEKLFHEIPVIRGENLELRKLETSDARSLEKLTGSDEVYRFLPTFLFEKKYEDAEYTVSRMYTEGLKKSLILGIFNGEEFCGLAEFYGYRAPFLKISVGYRLLPGFWGKGIATSVLGLMADFLFNETPVRIITASVMPDNTASAAVLKKNGFRCAAHSIPENWGHALPTKADKWIKTATGYHRGYRFRQD